MSYFVSGQSDPLTLREDERTNDILQNIRLILTTRKGTCPMYRDFGLTMNWLDMPITIAKLAIIPDVREAVERWEPRATVKNVSFKLDPSDSSILYPIVEVEINAEE